MISAFAFELGKVETKAIRRRMLGHLKHVDAKLVNDSNDVFSSFEACETLALGILGKKALWDALSAAIEIPSAQIDFEKLISRAEQQHKIIEGVRLDLAVLSLRRTE